MPLPFAIQQNGYLRHPDHLGHSFVLSPPKIKLNYLRLSLVEFCQLRQGLIQGDDWAAACLHIHGFVYETR